VTADVRTILIMYRLKHTHTHTHTHTHRFNHSLMYYTFKYPITRTSNYSKFRELLW